jgi:16S rRNA (cytosine967-C5)-methyltransferase
LTSPARSAAYEVVRRVFEDGAWADRALPAALERHGVEGRDRGLAQRLAYGAVQRRGSSDHVIRVLADRRPERLDDPVLAALRLGLYELHFSEAAPHAVVDEAVELAKGSPRGRRGAGLVNAVLRRAVREGPRILEELREDDPAGAAARHSYPTWLAELWWEELGPECAVALMTAMNRPAETALRANELRASRDELLAELRAGGVDAAPAPGPPPLDVRESVVVDGALGRAGTAAIQAGRAVGQSRSSAAAVAVLDPRPGERVLDLCAGPGMKTTMIAARMRNEGSIRSVELRPQRAALVAELAARLGATIVEAVEADAAASDDLGAGYDRVVVDPPCSDLGTLAARPDARWRKEPGDPARLATLQGEILAGGAAALAPGGTLVYSTCTISADENEGVVAALLERDGERLDLRADALGEAHPEVASERDPRFLQIRPDRDSSEGFFIARLRREAP